MFLQLFLFATPAYLAFVRSQRYRRLNALIEEYGKKVETEDLDPVSAQKIVQASQLYEQPFMMVISEIIALFKVYGIESVARLLNKTGQLKSAESVSRRVADTGILIFTWIANPLTMPGDGNETDRFITDPRHAIATARVNYLHNKYPIANDDFLYNLALFILTPVDWIARFEWRPHSDLEREALFVFWCEIGRRMGIKAIWSNYAEMEQWTKQYEEKYMVPNEQSHILANTSLDFLMARFPTYLGIRSTLKSIVVCFVDDRTREAMMLPKPHPLLRSIVFGAFHLRAFIIKYFLLPRTTPSLYVPIDQPAPGKDTTPGKLPRMKANYRRRPHPWYYPESTGCMARTWERIQVQLGLIKPEHLPNKRWRSEGYRIEELGPPQFEKECHVDIMEAAAKLQGAPVVGPWSLNWEPSKKD